VNSELKHNQEQLLAAKLEQDPSDWDTRQQLAHLLYDQGHYGHAAAVIWEADQIPSTDMDIAFAARILAKDQPRKAIRLLANVLQHNKGKSVQNLGMANALLHHGMVLQAARFYGAALEADSDLVNPDLEHFILWTDEEQTLWGDFKQRRPKLGELPWMARDPMEALKLTSRISFHTTPLSVPKLKAVPAEDLNNTLYQQAAEKGAKITPPPAVTIPQDRVQAKHRRYDSAMGADVDTSPSKPKASPTDVTQEVRIAQPAQQPTAAAPDPTPESQVPTLAQKPRLSPEPTPPAAILARKTPAASQPAAAQTPTKGAAIQISKPTVGPDGKIRRASILSSSDSSGSAMVRKPGFEPDVKNDTAATEAKAENEIT